MDSLVMKGVTRPCTNCQGSGIIIIIKDGMRIEATCGPCGGSGEKR